MIWNNIERAGLLPMMVSEISEADAVTQLNNGYAHGGGWNDFNGFTLEKAPSGEYSLAYPGDPAMLQVASAKLRDELIVLFAYDWVAVIQPDGSYRVARMD